MRQWIALILGMSTAVVAAAATNGTDSETIRIDDDDVRVSELREAIDDIADDAETIGYEILTSLGARYTRRYVEGTA